MGNDYRSRAHRWKQSGRVYLWRYLERERYPDWHMSLDEAALESLGSLFRFLDEDGTRCHRTFTISSPTDAILRVPNYQGGEARCAYPKKLRLYFDPAAEMGWDLAESGDPLQWQLGQSGLAEVVAFFADPPSYWDGYFGEDPGLWWWGPAKSAT